MSYKRKNIFIYNKKLQKIIIFIMIFAMQLFPFVAAYLFSLNNCILIIHGLFFRKNSTVSNLKNMQIIFQYNYIWLKKDSFKNIYFRDPTHKIY